MEAKDVNDLKGKIVLVTGSSSGIGASVAVAFARWGSHVAVHYNTRRDEASRIANLIREHGCRAELFQADVADTTQVERLAADVVAHFGRVDIVVNNAGSIVQRAQVSEADDALIERVFRLNARSMMALNRSIVPAMRSQKAGAIINLTSQAARTGGSVGTGLYASTKAYISTYTRALAKELVDDGIRVNAVAPGVIDTPIHDGITSPQLKTQLAGNIPMKRLGSADECAGAVLFLASEELASYVTGQVIEVNGGLIMP
jgi:3-oxoacyl-[acyl-carrier protein] reductase